MPRMWFTLLFVLASSAGSAQQLWDWVAPYATGLGRDIVTDPEGNTYAVHRFTPTDTAPFAGLPWVDGRLGAIAKYDPTGSIVWAHTMNMAFFDHVALTEDTLYAAGHAGYGQFGFGGQTWNWPDSLGQALLLSAYDLNGNMAWTQLDTIAGGTDVFDIEVNDNSEILLAMKFNGRVMWNGDSLLSDSSIPTLVKRSPGGNKLWYAQAYVSAKGAVNGVAALPDGGAAITGYFQGDTCIFGSTILTNSTFFMARADANGNFIWARDGYGATGNDIDLSLDDSLYVSGTFYYDSTNAFIPFHPSTPMQDMFLAKLGWDGEFGWIHTSGSSTDSSRCEHFGLCIDPNNNAFVLGRAQYGTVIGEDTLSNVSLFAEKVSPGGEHEWTATMDIITPDFLEPNGIGADGAGRAYISGTFRNGDLHYNSTIVPVASNYALFVARTTEFATMVLNEHVGDLDIFPNPTNGFVHCSGLRSRGAVDIMDMAGRAVLSLNAGAGWVDIGSLADGVYLFVVNDGAGPRCERVVLVH